MKKNIAVGIATALAGITPVFAMAGCNKEDGELRLTLNESKTFECSVTPIVSRPSDTENEYSAEYTFTLPGCSINHKVEGGEWKAKATLTIKSKESSTKYSLEGTVIVDDDLKASIVLKTVVLLVKNSETKIYPTDEASLPYADPKKYSITNLKVTYDDKTLINESKGLYADIKTNFLALHDPDAINCYSAQAAKDTFPLGKANENKNKEHSTSQFGIMFGGFWIFNTGYHDFTVGYLSQHFSANVTIVDKPDCINIVHTDFNVYTLANFTVFFEMFITDEGHTAADYGDYKLNIKVTDRNDAGKVWFDSTKDTTSPDFIFHYVE